MDKETGRHNLIVFLLVVGASLSALIYPIAAEAQQNNRGFNLPDRKTLKAGYKGEKGADPEPIPSDMNDQAQFEKSENPDCGIPGSELCFRYWKNSLSCLIYSHNIVWLYSNSFVIELLEPKIRSEEEMRILCENGPKSESPVHDGNFSGLYGHYVIGGLTIASEVRHLTAMDMDTGSQILNTAYQDGENLTLLEADENISFWRSDEINSPGICSNNSERVHHRVVFNLKTGKEITTSETKCFYRQ